MNTNSEKAAPPEPFWKRLLKRVVIVAIVATTFTLVLHYSSESTTANQPAGFGKGLLHGALMPGAMPHLLLGHDVTIYAPNNSGLPYKLGYTAGVNGCGAIFFGFLYWRFNRWRKLRKENGQP